MIVTIKGIICDTKLVYIIKEGGFNGYALFQSKMEELMSICDFTSTVEDTELYCILKLHNIKEEPILEELEGYTCKPDVQDYIELDGEELTIRKIVCHSSGKISVFVEKIVLESFIGSSLQEIKSEIVTQVKIRRSLHKELPTKKVFSIFRGGKD
jgi:predicted transcriptional regulator